MDLSLHDSRDKLDKVLHRLKWNDFPGLQALLLKVTCTDNNLVAIGVFSKYYFEGIPDTRTCMKYLYEILP